MPTLIHSSYFCVIATVIVFTAAYWAPDIVYEALNTHERNF